MADAFYCEKCNKTMNANQFYGSKNLEKYPEGKLHQCKKCITMHVDNWNPETYLWILQECDVPYIPDEWNRLLASYGNDKSKLTGTTILGRYLSKMKLNQWKKYSWKDTADLQRLAEHKIEETMKRQGYGAVEIAQAIEKGMVFIPEGELKEPEHPELQQDNIGEVEDYFAEQSGGDTDFASDLTDDDKTYLRLKWGKAYKPEEWVWLEQLYEEMMASYDIQGAGHIDTLKLICKTSLKANQLIDMGDVEGFQKMSKVYDSLMKSGKFTAAQNKAENGEFVDSLGELVELCEKQGYIERYYIDEPKDKVDFTIKDMKQYTKNLVEKETNLSALIEAAIKTNMREDEDAKHQDDEDEIVFEEDEEITDKDIIDFKSFVNQEIDYEDEDGEDEG